MSYSFKKFNSKNKFKIDISILSKLFFTSAKEYDFIFKKFKLKKKIFFNKILNKKNSEFEEFIILKYNKKTVGLISGFPSTQLRSRKFLSFLIFKNLIYPNSLNSLLKDNFSRLSTSNKSYYLSRLSVNTKYKKEGFGSKLIKKFISGINKKRFSSLTLHVNKKNKSAMRFYLKHDFKKRNTSKEFYCMERKI